mmetsp:Transcript_26197/g.60878  ORF Transcript_26197/g.60878 Transcript_26197/m.60878 type:complete len:221 (+) Transcript_26197:199-861(+)
MRLFAAPLTLPRLVVCPDAERGTLLDSPSTKTLERPDLHTLHCLVDVSFCHGSGFEILTDPDPGSNQYNRALRLDAFGNQEALSLGRHTGRPGSCGTCTGEEGNLSRGFRATVVGKLVPDSGNPPLLNTTRVLPAGSPCPSAQNVPTTTPTTMMPAAASVRPTMSPTATPVQQTTTGAPAVAPIQPTTNPPTSGVRPMQQGVASSCAALLMSLVVAAQMT